MDEPVHRAAVGVVLLAAGESRRLGRVKQLLPFAGTTLLRRACLTALATAASPVVVVLGAHGEACAAEIADLPVTGVHNPAWSEGMGGSLRVGLARLHDLAPEAAGVIVLLPDQTLVTSADLLALLAAWDPPRRPIAAAAYDGILGVPAVFARALFPELAALAGKHGARAVIAQHAAETNVIEIPAAAHDIDTPEDYARLLRMT